eukprot:1847475-Rhodomonas_salina.7
MSGTNHTVGYNQTLSTDRARCRYQIRENYRCFYPGSSDLLASYARTTQCPDGSNGYEVNGFAGSLTPCAYARAMRCPRMVQPAGKHVVDSGDFNGALSAYARATRCP